MSYPIGRWLGQRAARFEAIFERSVSIDGKDVGPLVRVESHVVDRSVILVTEGAETRVQLGSAEDAVVLAHALDEALLAKKKA